LWGSLNVLGNFLLDVQTEEDIPRPILHNVRSFVGRPVMETITKECGAQSIVLFPVGLSSGIKGLGIRGVCISSGCMAQVRTREQWIMTALTAS
jgi:hypothetical protein